VEGFTTLCTELPPRNISCLCVTTRNKVLLSLPLFIKNMLNFLLVWVVLYMHNLLRGHNIPPITIISHSISLLLLLLLFLCKLLSIPPDGDVVKNCTGENDVL
jgi:hypothetical protein